MNHTSLSAQRLARRPEEQHARLRRVYAYLVLFVAALVALFSLRDLRAAWFGAVTDQQAGIQVANALGSLVAYGAIWVYHWRLFGADRALIEQAEGAATLRRWYVLLAQAVSLVALSIGAIDLLDQVLHQLLVPAIGVVSSIGDALALLVAGLLIWLPHHLWANWLVRAPTPLRADEVRSTLRQVYAALAITVTAIAALGGLWRGGLAGAAGPTMPAIRARKCLHAWMYELCSANWARMRG